MDCRLADEGECVGRTYGLAGLRGWGVSVVNGDFALGCLVNTKPPSSSPLGGRDVDDSLEDDVDDSLDDNVDDNVDDNLIGNINADVDDNKDDNLGDDPNASLSSW